MSDPIEITKPAVAVPIYDEGSKKWRVMVLVSTSRGGEQEDLYSIKPGKFKERWKAQSAAMNFNIKSHGMEEQFQEALKAAQEVEGDTND